MIGQRTTVCLVCGLYDPYDGQGDGIGSCDCPRCPWCGAGPESCDCRQDGPCACGGDCWDDDEALRPVETVTAFNERGLL